MSTYCPECGSQNKGGALFCRKCGYRLKKEDNTEAGHCPECGFLNKEDSLFCENCGHQLKKGEVHPEPVYCPKCGSQNKNGAIFCRKCGHNLAKQIKEEKNEGERPENVVRALELGDKYYAQHEFVTAGEYYLKAYEMDPDKTAGNANAYAYNQLRLVKEQKIELFRVNPGVALVTSVLPKIDAGTEALKPVVLFNGSDKNARIVITPQEEKWITFEKESLTVEVVPGQFMCVDVGFTVLPTATTGEHEFIVDVVSDAVRYRAAEKGVEMVSKASSSLLPFSGVVTSYLLGKKMKNSAIIKAKVNVTGKWGIKWHTGTKKDAIVLHDRFLYTPEDERLFVRGDLYNDMLQVVQKMVNHPDCKNTIKKIIPPDGSKLNKEIRSMFVTGLIFNAEGIKRFARISEEFLFMIHKDGGFLLVASSRKDVDQSMLEIMVQKTVITNDFRRFVAFSFP
jgi:ribosomal protein L40E